MTVSPYPGVRPFARADAAVFCGRTGELSALVSLVTAHPVVLVHGPSGAGKTSLLQAGLIPALEEDGFEILPIARVRPSRRDLEADAAYAHGLAETWRESGDEDDRPLAEVLGQRAHPLGPDGFLVPRVAIVDQLEELFVLPSRPSQREYALSELADALALDPLLRLVLCIREDFVPQLDVHAHVLPGALRARLRLGLLARPTALEAIAGPLRATGRTLVPGTGEDLVDDLLAVRMQTPDGDVVTSAGDAVEPVQLQVVLSSLWRELESEAEEGPIDFSTYRVDAGDVLSRFVDDAIVYSARESNTSEPELRRTLEAAFMTPAGTRAMVFAEAGKARGALSDTAMAALERTYLIRGEWRAGARWYELSHDRFIEPVKASNRRFFESRPRSGFLWRRPRR